MTLHIGVGLADVTPAPGTPLGGYPVDGRVSSGVHDPLQVLALSARDADSGDHLVLVCFDGISVPDQMMRELDLGPDTVVVPVASHTHAAPSLAAWDQGVMGEYSESYQTMLIETTRRVAVEAMEAEASGHLMLGTGTLDEPVGTNRRDQDGPRDDKVRVIEARTDEEVLALLVLHGCHPTVLSAENTLVSNDLVWGLRERVSASLRAVPLAYLPGGAGDQSTRHTRRESSYDEASRLGATLGDAVVAARPSMTRVDRFQARHATLALASRPTPSLDVAERQWQYWTAETERRRIAGDPSAHRQAEVELIGANHIVRRARDDVRLPDQVEVLVTRWNLDGRSVAFWPVEPTMGLALDLEQDDDTWLCGYASGYFGYLLPEPDCERGGYEVAASAFDCGAASAFIEQTRRLGPPADTSYDTRT